MSIGAGVGSVGDLRWDPYFLCRGGEFQEFWREHLGERERRLLFLLGRGFDPRMRSALEAILAQGGTGQRDCMLLAFDEGVTSPSRRHDDLVSANETAVEGLLRGRGTLTKKAVPMWNRERRRVGALRAAAVIGDVSEIQAYTDVVVDVSAMPSGIYFPLIAKLLHLLDHTASQDSNGAAWQLPNLHVVVAEDAVLDRQIRHVGVDDPAAYVFGFVSDLQMEATAEVPKVWIPILGEGQAVQLERIHHLVDPREICPVLPSPSRDPRRGDNLVLEYRELLVDRWRVEPRNIIYASEQNPFEAYRQIHSAVCHYNRALKPLGGCKAAITALSSKLLSVGALLAAYELKETGFSAGIAHVEVEGYEMDAEPSAANGTVASDSELFSLWLVGECYAP